MYDKNRIINFAANQLKIIVRSILMYYYILEHDNPRLEKCDKLNIVREHTTFVNCEDKTKVFSIERYYNAIQIRMVSEEPVIDIDDYTFGVDIKKYLRDKYPDSEIDVVSYRCYGANRLDMPESVMDKMNDMIENDYFVHYDWDGYSWIDGALCEFGWQRNEKEYPTEWWIYNPLTVKLYRPHRFVLPVKNVPHPPLDPLEELTMEEILEKIHM